jgi:hypothetical protein
MRRRAAQESGEAPVVKLEAVVKPVGVRDVATSAQMEHLAKQRAELYALENERKILKMKREIQMEKITEESGAQLQRVDNWVSDVKSGATRSSGSGWASQATRKTKWSGSWRSRQTVSTEDTGVSEEVHKAVLARVAELEAQVAIEKKQVEAAGKAAKEKRFDAEIERKVQTDERVMRWRAKYGEELGKVRSLEAKLKEACVVRVVPAQDVFYDC